MTDNKMVLITGVAGFIGFSLSRRLLEKGYNIIGIDNMNDYYDVGLKKTRLHILMSFPTFAFKRIDISSEDDVKRVFSDSKPSIVVHLAAQAGVRYSSINPRSYIESNIVGFYNILEACRQSGVKHFIFASSSSVYGNSKGGMTGEESKINSPVSLYAATKVSGEALAFSYHSLYKIPMTGLRFFTVYGPYGRPDMAYFKFANHIIRKEPIPLYNRGEMLRDFTYVDDVVLCLVYFVESIVCPNRYEVYNVGTGKPEPLTNLIKLLEEYLGIRADVRMLEMQLGDVFQTHADISKIKSEICTFHVTPLRDGVKRFIDWYKSFYDIVVSD